MNKRIAQLITESGGYWNHGDFGFPSSVDFQEKDIEKFAELIVRECIEACSRANEIRHFVPPTQEQVVLSCMREIKNHFGVEE